jgi:carbamate kinase
MSPISGTPCARRPQRRRHDRGRLDAVVTHGNGPQVGFILRRNELAAHEVHPTPLDLIVADTQGSIGFMLQQTLNNEFHRRKLVRQCITLVTQVLVDSERPGLCQPHQTDRQLFGRGERA